MPFLLNQAFLLCPEETSISQQKHFLKVAWWAFNYLNLPSRNLIVLTSLSPTIALVSVLEKPKFLRKQYLALRCCFVLVSFTKGNLYLLILDSMMFHPNIKKGNWRFIDKAKLFSLVVSVVYKSCIRRIRRIQAATKDSQRLDPNRWKATALLLESLERDCPSLPDHAERRLSHDGGISR